MLLRETTTGRIVCERLELATTFWRRFVGLQLRRELPAGNGLLLAPCRALHTCWMRFAIDVAFLDRSGVVVAVRTNLRPWRAVGAVDGAFASLELPAGTCDLKVGERLVVEGAEPLPRTLANWG